MPSASIGALLSECGIEAREARLMLARACAIETAIVAAFPERTVASDAATRFRQWVRRRRSGEPVAYIVGEREFFGRCFTVSPAVLIPRPETELLVECAIEHAGATARPRVLDLGTGSGIVAITLACELPAASVTAVDSSGEALAVARRNGDALAPDRVEFLLSDWFSRLAGRRFDLIVGNPPYVALGDAHLGEGDLRFEPQAALVGGSDGIECIDAITVTAAGYLDVGGWLLLEHGFDQGEAVRGRLLRAGYESVRTWRDLEKRERVSGGRLDIALHSQPGAANRPDLQ